MRVLFVQQQPCMRALKYASGLHARHPDHRLAFAYRGRTLTEWYGTGDELFDGWWHLDGDPAAGLRRAVEEFRPDVIHSHNLPDELTVMTLEATGGAVPVIHDVHDMQSLRATPYEDGFPEPLDPLALERIAVEQSAAVIAVSDELLAELAARYRLPARTLAFANYALERDLPAALPAARTPAGRPRLVYQGTLADNGGHYDLRDIFADIAGQGVELDVFPSRPPGAGYRELAERLHALRLHRTLRPADLLRTLPRYDLGWAGFNTGLNRAHLDTALPNKAFEYLGCGLPVVTMGHRALVRFVEEHGVGISLESLDDLPGRLAALDLPALRRRVAAARRDVTLESRIARVADLYEAVAV